MRTSVSPKSIGLPSRPRSKTDATWAAREFFAVRWTKGFNVLGRISDQQRNPSLERVIMIDSCPQGALSHRNRLIGGTKDEFPPQETAGHGEASGKWTQRRWTIRGPQRTQGFSTLSSVSCLRRTRTPLAASFLLTSSWLPGRPGLSKFGGGWNFCASGSTDYSASSVSAPRSQLKAPTSSSHRSSRTTPIDSLRRAMPHACAHSAEPKVRG